MKRSFNATFADLPHDVDLAPVSWRSGLHSDLLLHLGSKRFAVHKICVGHGPRASAFLNRACLTSVGREQSDTSCRSVDLSSVLPEPLWGLLDCVLDFVYNGEIDIQEDTVVKLVACAQVLQIRALFDRCCEPFESGKFPTVAGAPQLLVDVALADTDVRAAVAEAAKACIVEHFDEYLPATLSIIPLESLKDILQHDDLNVSHEDHVFDLLAELLPLLGEGAARLWSMCRLPEVSKDRLRRANEAALVPVEILLDSLTSQSLGPRNSFKGIKCLVLSDITEMHNPWFFDYGGWPYICDWYLHLKALVESRGGDVELGLMSAKGKGKGKTGLDTHEVDVILYLLEDDEPWGFVREQEEELKRRVNAGVALVFLREDFSDYGFHPDVRFFGDYEPFSPMPGPPHLPHGSGTENPPRHLGYRIPKAHSGEGLSNPMVRNILCGVNLNQLHTRKSYPFRSARVSAGAHVIVETGHDEAGWRPACALHSTRLIASVWDDELAMTCPGTQKTGAQLVLNLLRVLGRQSRLNRARHRPPSE